MKKLLAVLTALVMMLGLATVVGASNAYDPATWDVSIFEIPADFNEHHEDLRDDYLGVECWEPVGLGIEHFVKGYTNYYKWLNKTEKMPDCVNGVGCLSMGKSGIETIVFWNGVPNLSKNLFKWAEGITHDVYIPDSVTEINEECFVEGSAITLHFTKNHAVALAYAQNRGMAFEVMDGERVSGDVNFDKSVDMKDTLSLRKSIAKLPAAVEIYSTDLNGDGSIDMKDVLILRKQIATAAA